MEMIFKTRAFGGFDKKEVLQCLNEYYEKNTALENQLHMSKSQNDTQKAEYLAQLKEHKECEDKHIALLAESEKHLLNQNDAVEKLKSLLASMSEKNSECTKKALLLANENAQLKKTIDEANQVLFQKIEELNLANAKAEEFDKFKLKQKDIQSKINEFLEKAKAKADSVVVEATLEADAIKSRAFVQAEEIIQDAEDVTIAMDKLRQDTASVLNFIDAKSMKFQKATDKLKK